MRTQSQIYSRYFTYIKPVTRLPIIRTYGSTIFTLLVMAVFIIFAIRPTVETILVLQKKLADSNLVLEKVNKKAESLTLGKQNYENFSPNIKSKLIAAIPDNTQIKTIIQTLETTAQNHQASVSALQFQPLTLEPKAEDKIGALTEISFVFNVEGEYKNITSLLQDLKTSDRLLSIDHLSISKVSEGKGLIMSISGKAYYLK